MTKIMAAQRLVQAEQFARKQALARDKSVYVDKERGKWCVFGNETGYCYDEYDTEEEATKQAEALKPGNVMAIASTNMPLLLAEGASVKPGECTATCVSVIVEGCLDIQTGFLSTLREFGKICTQIHALDKDCFCITFEM